MRHRHAVRYSRAIGARTFAVAAAAVIALGSLMGGATVALADQPHANAQVATPVCSSTSVRDNQSTNLGRYGPGATVIMTASVRNVSRTRCTIAIGALSPSFTVTDAKGRVIWNNCYAHDQPAPCPQYLIKRTLRPGGAFTRSARWDQGVGATRARVAPGTYYLQARFLSIGSGRRLAFVLTPNHRSRTITITDADSGHTYQLRRGDRLVVQFTAPSLYTWSEPLSSNQRVLRRVSGSSGSITSTVFMAASAGVATVRATESPTCYPQCLPPSRLFTVTVHVLA